MRYAALATDYDGTLAERGAVHESTWAAIERLRASGRRVVLVTGRELEELFEICPRVDLFDRVVAENGALLYRPGDRSERAARPPAARRLPPGPDRAGGRADLGGPGDRGDLGAAPRGDRGGDPGDGAGPPGDPQQAGPDGPARRAWTRPRAWPGPWPSWASTRADAVGVGDAENDADDARGLRPRRGRGQRPARAEGVGPTSSPGASGAGVAELIGRILDGTLPDRSLRG